jgi:hypothetical protein
VGLIKPLFYTNMILYEYTFCTEPKPQWLSPCSRFENDCMLHTSQETTGKAVALCSEGCECGSLRWNFPPAIATVGPGI